MKHVPGNAVAYRRTPEFSESDVPAALRSAHSTKHGVWGRICVVGQAPGDALANARVGALA